MIRLSKLTDYAVALLSHMGREGKEGLWTAASLTEASGLPMPTVAKVLKILAKSGIITAQRGASGGYKLSRLPRDIAISAVIEAMDGPIAITDCAEGKTHTGCLIEAVCPLSNGWNKVNRAVRAALDTVTLEDMGSMALPFAEAIEADAKESETARPAAVGE